MKTISITTVFFLILLSSNKNFGQYKIASESNIGKTTKITTQYDKGFVVKNDGQRLEGKIQLKIVNKDTVEVRLKNASNKKIKFKRAALQSFGLTKMISDVREANFAAKNFHKGYIILKNGTKKEGKIALRFTLGGTQRYFAKKILMEKENNEYKTLTFKDEIQFVAQIINGETNVYEWYKDGFSKHLQNGSLVLMRNPYATSKNEFLSGVANAFKEDLAKEVAKETLKEELKNKNGDINNVKENYEAVNSIDVSINRKEYLVRPKNATEFTIIKKENVKDWADKLFLKCTAYKELPKKERKRLRNLKSVVEAVGYYNQFCK